VKSMPNKEQFRSTQLLQQAKELGLLDNVWTLTCIQCHAVFPEEYGNCPKCSVDESFKDIQIDFEI